MPGQGTAPTKLAGKARPKVPKNITGAVQTSTTEWDYTDGTAVSNFCRGQDPTYAMPRDAINADLRVLGMPFIRLLGDEFCTATESQINLLADVTPLVGTGPLTNNNSVTFTNDVSDDESPTWNNIVANFASASSQYLSVPTAAAVQVGTNSYEVSIAFKTITQSTLMYLFSYGSHVTAKAYWEAFFDANGKINFAQWDGTNTDTVTDSYANIYNDGRWHILTAVIDRTNLKIYVDVDGRLINAGGTTVTATGTLTIAGENLYLGANKSSGGSVGNYFNGSLALFKLINNAADYNVPAVWNMGTREAVSSGTWAVAAQSNNRLNNQFSNTTATTGDYSYCTSVFEDGEYEIQANLDYLTNGGQAQVLIDGNPVTWSTKNAYIDTYNGSTTYNNVTKAYGFKLSAGRHTIKLLSNAKNGSSSGFLMQYAWLNFIKRRGHENGGLVNAFLLGDEISERTNSSGGLTLTNNTAFYYDNNYNNTTPANNDYAEGTIFLKGGLYQIDIVYNKDTDRGIINLWFGNVQVINALDTYNGSTSSNVVNTVYVRLQQGRTDVRLSVNGKNASSSNYRWLINSIRLERLSD